MAFAVPNADDVTNEPVAGIDGNELVHIAVSHENFVESGCAVTTTGSGIQLAVAAGTVVVEGVPVTVSSGNVTPTADGTNPRFSIVTVNGSGTIEITNGTPVAYSAGSTTPEYPAWPADKTVLAVVYVPAGATSAGQLEIVDKRIIRRRDYRVDALSPGTGITGDGTTDDHDAIETLLESGAAIYFPAATYSINAGIDVSTSNSVDVLCSPAALFKPTANVINDAFGFGTTGVLALSFRWVGGVVDGGLMPNSSSSASRVDVGLYNQPTSSSPTNDLFSFRDALWASITVEDTVFTSREGSYLLSPTNHANHHWMGDPTTNTPNGADSHIFANCGPGTVTIRNTTHYGSRDSAIYLAGVGSSGGPSLTTIDGVKVYWATSAISVKSTITQVTVSNCLAYGCATGFEAEDTASNAGSDAVTYIGCTTRRTGVGFENLDSTRTRWIDCAAYDLGYVDWQGNGDTTEGYVQITSASAGSAVTGITVDGVAIMSGTVNFDTDVATTARAVAANINAHTSSPNYHANANNLYTGVWRVFITGTGGDGDVVAVTTTGTITTATSNMAHAFTLPRGFVMDGGEGVVVDGLYVDGIDSVWATDRAASPDVRAVYLRSGDDVDSVDTTVRNLYADNVTSLGGEYTNPSAAANIDRTHFDGVRTGNGMTSFAAPVLVGANSSFNSGLVVRKRLGSTQTVNNSTTRVAPTGFTIPVHNGRWYLVRVIGVWNSTATADIRVEFVPPSGSHSGYWRALGQASGSSSLASTVHYEPKNWTQNHAIGMGGAPFYTEVWGHFGSAGTGTLEFRWAQATAEVSDTTLDAGAIFEVEWIG